MALALRSRRPQSLQRPQKLLQTVSMAEPKDIVGEPVGDRGIELFEFAGEKVIDAFHHNQMSFTVERSDQRFNFVDGAEFVVSTMHKKFGFFARRQKREVGSIHGDSQADEMRDSRMLAAH